MSPKTKTLGAKTPQGKRFSGLFNVAAISANRHGFSLDYGLKDSLGGRQSPVASQD
jgi:hypothetical protein